MSADTGYLSDEEVAEEVIHALSLVQQSRQENQELKKNFESLKNLHVQLQTANKQLQGRFNVLYEERVTVERQYQQLCESWRAELEEKQRQFDHVRAQLMGPRDLDVLKVRLLEEVEGPYRHKCELLAKEAELAQQSFVQLRREHEELQSARKTLELRTVSEMERQRADQTAVVTDLKDRLAVYSRATSQLAATQAQVRAFERERGDAVLANASLREEIEDLRKEKGRVVADKDGVALRVERRVKAIQAEELELSGLVESLTRKNRHLAKELAEAQRAQEDVYAQVLSHMSSVATAQSALDTARRQHAVERSAMEAQFDAARVKLEDRASDLLDEVGRKENRMAEMAMSHQQELSRLSQSYEHAATEAAGESAEKLRELREEVTQRGARGDALTQACEESQREVDEAKRKARAEADRERVESASLQSRLDDARSRVTALEAELQASKQDHDSVRRDRVQLELQGQHLSRRRDELEVRLAALEHELRDGIARRDELQQEVETAKRRNEEMRVSHLSYIETSRGAAAAEKAALTKRYQAAVQEQALRAAAEVKKSKRRAKSAAHGAQQMTDELTALKLRAHEQQTAAAGQGPGGYLGGGQEVLSPRDGGGTPVRYSGLPLGGMMRAGRGDDDSVFGVNRQVLGDIADLQARQQEYLRAAAAAAGGTRSSSQTH